MNVAALEELAADGLARAAFEQDIVGNDDSSAAIHFQEADDVLHEVDLLVAGGGPEIVAIDDQRFPALLAFFIDDGDA